MHIKNAARVFTLVVALVATAAIAAPHHFAGDKYAKLAKVGLDEARATALKARPGTITDQELERERGGSGLRYSFDIKATDAPFDQ